MTTFTCSDGRELTIKPVSRILTQAIVAKVRREMETAGEPLNPPTYTVETVAGVKETHPHDEATLQTDEDRAAWVAYQAAQGRLNAEVNQRVTRAMLIDGVVGHDDVPDGRAAYYEDLGIEWPADPGDRKVLYLQLEYLPAPQDLTMLWVAIMELSTVGVNGDEVAAARQSFRGQVEGQAPGGAADTGQ